LEEFTHIGIRRHRHDLRAFHADFTLRNWIVSKYPKTFVKVATEKLLIYALGRGKEWQDMPLIRSIQREANKGGNKFSALVLAVVKSKPFQMNTKVQPVNTSVTASSRTNSDKGNN